MIEWGGGVRDVICIWGGGGEVWEHYDRRTLKNRFMMRINWNLPRRTVTTAKHRAEETSPHPHRGGGGGGVAGPVKLSDVPGWYNRMIARRGGGGGGMCHLNSRQELILIHKSMPKSRPSRSAFASSVLLCMLCCAMGVNSDYFRMYNGPWIRDIIYIMGEVWRTPAGIVPVFELSMTGRCRLTRSFLAAALEQTRSSEPQKIREERCWSQIQKSPSPFATIGHIPKEMLHLHVCGGIGTLWILLCNLNGEIRAGRQNCCTWVTPRGGGGGGTQMLFGRGCAADPNLYPSLRVILAEKGTHY